MYTVIMHGIAINVLAKENNMPEELLKKYEYTCPVCGYVSVFLSPLEGIYPKYLCAKCQTIIKLKVEKEDE